MKKAHQQAVLDAINRMFSEERHFSICTVDRCMEVTGAPKNEDYKALRLYHCADYSSMSRETKKWLYETAVHNILAVPDFPVIKFAEPEVEPVEIEAPKRSVVARLFNR